MGGEYQKVGATATIASLRGRELCCSTLGPRRFGRRLGGRVILTVPTGTAPVPLSPESCQNDGYLRGNTVGRRFARRFCGAGEVGVTRAALRWPARTMLRLGALPRQNRQRSGA